MGKEKLKEISKSLKFNLNDKIISEIDEFYEDFVIKMNNLKEINTDNIEPMTRVDNTPITFMREDEVGDSLDKKIILNNAPDKDADFVIINKEVSND